MTSKQRRSGAAILKVRWRIPFERAGGDNNLFLTHAGCCRQATGRSVSTKRLLERLPGILHYGVVVPAPQGLTALIHAQLYIQLADIVAKGGQIFVETCILA